MLCSVRPYMPCCAASYRGSWPSAADLYLYLGGAVVAAVCLWRHVARPDAPSRLALAAAASSRHLTCRLRPVPNTAGRAPLRAVGGAGVSGCHVSPPCDELTRRPANAHPTGTGRKADHLTPSLPPPSLQPGLKDLALSVEYSRLSALGRLAQRRELRPCSVLGLCAVSACAPCLGLRFAPAGCSAVSAHGSDL